MEFVGSRFGDHVDDSAQNLSELGFIVVGLNLEFLNVIQRRLHRIGIANGAVVVNAIQQTHAAAVILARDRRRVDGSDWIPNSAEARVPRSIDRANSW